MSNETKYVIDLPYKRPPITMNSSFSWKKKHGIVSQLRKDAMNLGKYAKIKPGSHMTVHLFYAPGRRIRIDPPNLYAMVKPLVDGLARGNRKDWVGLEIVPDDTKEYVTIPEPTVLFPPTLGPRFWLVVTVRS